MKTNRKIPTKEEMIEQLWRDGMFMPPLSFRFLEREPMVGKNRRLDALIEASWKGKVAKFVVECRPLWTPMAFQNGIIMLKSLTLPKDYQPMLFLPFLSEDQLLELEREGISGIDMCGNGVVVVPGLFTVYRSGAKNRFSLSAPIKNIYRKNSSMVGRVFLVRPVFKAVQEVRSEINQRNLLVERWDKKPMSLSTVSKALSTLEQDLIVARGETIRLLQPDKLLEKLSDNYAYPNVTERLRLKVHGKSENIHALLSELAQMLDIPIVATGISSVKRYAVMQRGDLLSVYCPRLDKLLERLPGNQTTRLPNLELIETEDETVYFDARQEGYFSWASPIQVYLELKTGDKRDRQTAEQVKSFLLKGIEQEQ